ncbi:hypothetical protein CPC08DRAFT_822754 [Agrocybe pediades]|nr:hypothetical protein CPC08DRAFT_822754 [Agrocybe pediades]
MAEEKQVPDIIQDKAYYLNGRYAIFRAGNVLFRIPIEPLVEQSQFFAGMFSLPVAVNSGHAGEITAREGDTSDKTDNSPGRCDCERVPFITNTCLSLADPFASLQQSQLEAVLRLSTLWRFISLRHAVVDHLGSNLPDPFMKIRLGRRFHVRAWVEEGLFDLVNRADAISDQEALEFVPEPDLVQCAIRTLAAVSRIREKKERENPNSKGYVVKMTADDIEKQIQIEFGEELKAIQKEEEGYENGDDE